MYYEFWQNNSGGDFIENDDVTHTVFIEADNAEEANEKALEIGIYFNGVDLGRDCECCGNRWSPTHEGRGYEDTNNDEYTIVYHKDGRVTRNGVIMRGA